MRRYRYLIFPRPFQGILLILLMAINQAGLPAESLNESIQHKLLAAQTSIHGGNERLLAIPSLKKLYASRGYLPIWWVNSEPGSAAKQLLEEISASYLHGLKPEDYHQEFLRSAMSDIGWKTDIDKQAGIELALSDAWLELASHYMAGKVDSKTIDPQWTPSSRKLDLVKLFMEAASNGNQVALLRTLPPQQSGYLQLKAHLARARAEPGANLPVTTVSEGKILQPGDDNDRVLALRRRLYSLFPTLSLTGSYDAELQDAVRQFQVDHELSVDGKVGSATLRMLNPSPADRIDTIRVNLERWRWLPDDLGNRHIRVNIADFHLETWENGKIKDKMKVVIGRSYRRTPLFSDQIRYLVFNPAWELPRSIAIQDKLPLLQKNPGALAEAGYVIVNGNEELDLLSVNWKTVNKSNFRYQLRQHPGPKNALGRVKIMFPNSYNVYLHDTSNPELFQQNVRTFSSGCIRIQEPILLSEWLLHGVPDWGPDEIQFALGKKETRTAKLSKLIPIHIGYMTAWVSEDGKPHFRDDIYQRDAAVLKALDASKQ